MSRSLPCAPRRRSSSRELARLHDAALPSPATAPAEFDLAVWSRPLGVIGGDALAAWVVGPDRLLVFLADVMGHDLPAALVASALHLDLYRLRQAVVTSPADVLQRLDRAIVELFPGYFVTAACCVLDARAGTLTWSLAGHQPLLLQQPDGRVSLLHNGAAPLGLLAEDECRDEVLPFEPGASVVLYSDGVSDPLGGPHRLPEVLSDATGSAEELLQTLRQAIEPHHRHDDRAILVVRRR